MTTHTKHLNFYAKFQAMNPAQKKAVRYLVEQYAYAVDAAIQQVHFFGSEALDYPFDYRVGRVTSHRIADAGFSEGELSNLTK